jgi:predicted transport protein
LGSWPERPLVIVLTLLESVSGKGQELEHFVAFRRLKNFACVKRHNKDMLVWARLDPSTVALEEGFTPDVIQIGHAGRTGDLEIRIQNAADLERAQPLLLRSYQGA